jgi:hypothetical protein
MKKNENGFSAVELLIIVVVAGLIGAAGWIVYARQKDKPSNNQAAPQTTQQETKADTSATAGWAKYSLDGISFSYPADWSTAEESINADGIGISVTLTKGSTQLGSFMVMKDSKGYDSVLQEEKGYSLVDNISESVVNGIKVISLTAYGTDDKDPVNRTSVRILFVNNSEYRLGVNPNVLDSTTVDNIVKSVQKS